MCFLAELACAQVVGPPVVERHDGTGRVGAGGGLEHLAEDRLVQTLVADLPEGQAEGMSDEARERRLRDAGDGGHLGDRHGGDAGFVQATLEQSDRLLADRSGGHQQREVGLLVVDALDRRGYGSLSRRRPSGTNPIVDTTVGARAPMNPSSARRWSVRTG